MTTFAYTSGDPSHLTAGGNATMADLQGPLVDLRTFLNGNITDVNLSASAALTEAKLATGSNGLAKGAFSAYRAAAQTVATGAVIVFDTKDFDVSGWYTTANGRYTPQVPGYYRLSTLSLLNAVIAAGQFYGVEIFKNGVVHKRLQRTAQVSGGPTPHSLGSVLVAANGTTDFFDVRVNHNTGAGEGLELGAAFCYFQGELVGRT